MKDGVKLVHRQAMQLSYGHKEEEYRRMERGMVRIVQGPIPPLFQHMPWHESILTFSRTTVQLAFQKA